jgi:hypothetical protein
MISAFSAAASSGSVSRATVTPAENHDWRRHDPSQFGAGGAHGKFGRALVRHANCKTILSNLFGASRTYQEGYVTPCLQQSATKITTDGARTNHEYSHLRSPSSCSQPVVR